MTKRNFFLALLPAFALGVIYGLAPVASCAVCADGGSAALLYLEDG